MHSISRFFHEMSWKLPELITSASNALNFFWLCTNHAVSIKSGRLPMTASEQNLHKNGRIIFVAIAPSELLTILIQISLRNRREGWRIVGNGNASKITVD